MPPCGTPSSGTWWRAGCTTPATSWVAACGRPGPAGRCRCCRPTMPWWRAGSASTPWTPPASRAAITEPSPWHWRSRTADLGPALRPRDSGLSRVGHLLGVLGPHVVHVQLPDLAKDVLQRRLGQGAGLAEDRDPVPIDDQGGDRRDAVALGQSRL